MQSNWEREVQFSRESLDFRVARLHPSLLVRSEVANISDDSGGIPDDNCIRRYILGYDGPRSDECVMAHTYPRDEGDVRPNLGVVLDCAPLDPEELRLGGSWESNVRAHKSRRDEDAVAHRRVLADVDVRMEATLSPN